VQPTPSPEFLSLQQAIAGRYSLERELGRGGMGIVFLARDVALDRLVAIKLLPPALAATPDFRERFLREARTAAGLAHPNIVPIHLVEARDDLVYFVMAYVEGESLGQRIRRRGALPPSQVGRIVQEVAWALAYAHEHGVVHRDIKPDNILLEKGSERAIVTDFGIARVADAGSMTGQGELVGTVHYMSPEQATGERVDGRSDLYSLGVTTFYALTGRLPFEGANLPAVIHQHVNARAPRVAGVARGVPPRLAEAVDRCLAKAPEGRFRTAEELAAAVGAGTPARKDVPPEIRSLLRHLRETGIVLGGAASVIGWSGAMFNDLYAQLWAAGGEDLIFLTIVVGGSLLTYPVRLLSMTRRATRKGLGLGDVRAALGDEAQVLAEELELEGHRQASTKLTKREKWIRRGPLLAVLGAGMAAVGVYAGDLAAALLGPLALLAGLVLIGAGPTVDEESPVRALPITERLLVGRFGRLLFRLAGRGLDQPEPAELPAIQHTEAFLASAADGIFDRLPVSVRARVPDLPLAIARLEADARALRKREDALSRAIAEAAPAEAPRGAADRRRDAVGDLEAARDRVRERLEQAVAALEGIRLDLLRLHAGVGSPDDLTADLDQAREVNEAVNAELEGRREVEKLL
jgi:serine/threonine-protein kinase